MATYAFEDKGTFNSQTHQQPFDHEIHALEYDQHAGKLEPSANDVRDMGLFGIQPTFTRRFKFVAMVGFASTVVMCWRA